MVRPGQGARKGPRPPSLPSPPLPSERPRFPARGVVPELFFPLFPFFIYSGNPSKGTPTGALSPKSRTPHGMCQPPALPLARRIAAHPHMSRQGAGHTCAREAESPGEAPGPSSAPPGCVCVSGQGFCLFSVPPCKEGVPGGAGAGTWQAPQGHRRQEEGAAISCLLWGKKGEKKALSPSGEGSVMGER